VVYANDLKTAFSDVPPMLIAEHGAVSKEVANALAEGIRKRCNSSLGVGITGIAGPGGRGHQRNLSAWYMSQLQMARSRKVIERKVPGDRERVRFYASQLALDMVRRKLI